MHFCFHVYGAVPGRKRCPLPEIHNPDFESRNSVSAGAVRSVLALILVFTFFFGAQHLCWSKSPAPVKGNRMQWQAVQAETPQAPSPMVGDQRITIPGKFGWITFIAEPLYLILRFIHNNCIGNWGWSIVVLTVIFNLLLIWPRLMSMQSSLKMMRLQPKVDALKKCYAHLKITDPKREELNTKMMALYRTEGANVFGGCLPLLLQLPLLFAYMSVLRNTTELRQAHWLWLADLSSPDPLHILPLLIIGSMVLAQCLTPAPSMSPSQRWMFAILMPAIIGFSLWHYASGLSLYWFTGNIINLLIQFAMNRSRLGKEMHALTAARAKDSLKDQ